MPATDDTAPALTGPIDSAERFALIEMDPPHAVGSAPIAAPVVTKAPAVAASPLAAGRALLLAATHDTLGEAAQAVAKACEAAGLDKAHPTRTELRGLYRAILAAFVWVRVWGSLSRAVAQRGAQGVSVVVPPLVASEAPATPTVTGDALIDTLAAAAALGGSGPAAGSLRDGSMRGVGFSTAAGYVTALAHGVKRATADSYLQTLGAQYGYTTAQLQALTVTIIVDSALPVGAGITHTPTGPDVFTQQREARRAATALIRETADATTLALAQRLVVADSPLAWWEIGWQGAGSITRGELITACGEAPDAKISSTQLARTLDSLRGTHDASMVSVRPAGVKVRWQIGRGAQHAAFVGAEYGKVLAIVDLCADGSLSFDGDVTIADEVRAEYSRLCDSEVLRPGDVTTWLQQQLRRRFGAVRNGERFLISPQHKAAARDLCGKIALAWSCGGWVRGRIGDDGVPELGVTYQDVATVIGGIWQGLAAEVAEAEERWTATVAAAKAGKVGARACANELERIDGALANGSDGLRARVDGMRLIGEGPLAPLRARVVALRATVQAAADLANDSTSQRFAALDLT